MSLPRILVTGADGFVGRHLRPVLATALPGAEIQGTDRVDITDRAAVFAAVAAALPTVCVHLAGIAAVGQALADQPRAWAVNLHGALNLADAILAHAPDCRLIFISSAEVYGGSFKAGVALDETAALAPMNLYAATKAAAELALGAMAGNGLRLLRLRPFNHTGPGQAEAFVVPAFAGQMRGLCGLRAAGRDVAGQCSAQHCQRAGGDDRRYFTDVAGPGAGEDRGGGRSGAAAGS
jgi:GDP-4-dehydro-6-deoxy-D-mannose reductase